MQNMGTALMGTGEAEGDKRALRAAETAIANPLLDEMSMRGAKGLLISITGSFDMTLYEVEEATSRVRREIDPDSNPDINIIMGAIFDHSLEGRIRVSVVATGINAGQQPHVSNTGGEKSSRLIDRIGVSRAESEKPAGRASNDSGESWQGSGNVTIEPRSPKYLVNSPTPSRTSKPQAPQFEPQPPAKPIRPPRRPLTGKDFPELAEHEAEMQDRFAPPGQFKRKGGLLDWVTGRGRPSDAPTQDRMPPSLEPLRPIDEKAGQGNEGEDRAANQDSSGGRDGKATGRGRNGDEPLEMPKFLKRPLN
jgi:cell division protein FtsZ